MYNYMVFRIHERKLHKDFLAYYRQSETDEYYIVSLDHPELIKYLTEYLYRHRN